MKIFNRKKQAVLKQVGEALHLTKPKTLSEKIINTVLHLLLYCSLILIGYLLAQLSGVR